MTSDPASSQARSPGCACIELGTLLAGPFCGQLLGDFGAEVIKIEPPGQGDPMRVWGREKANGKSLWWPVVGRNKKAITLDLRQADGQDLLKQLVAKSDFLLENFRPGHDGELGPRLAPSCRRSIPRLIMIRVSGFRPDRPLFAPGRFRRDRRGHGRPALRGRRSVHAAVAHGHLDRRFARGHFRLHRRALRAAPPREDRPRPGGRLGDLRSRAQHDGVAGHRVRQGRLHPRAHRRDPAERRAVERLQDQRRPGADRREPGHRVLPPRRGDGPAGPRHRPERYATHGARGANQEELDALVERWTQHADHARGARP